MTDPRIEAAAIALYGDVNKGHAATKGWGEVLPRWQESYRSNARAALAAADKAATITTVEELDALPADAVILADTVAYQKCGDHWDGAGRTWGTGQLVGDLPARVIHWGTE